MTPSYLTSGFPTKRPDASEPLPGEFAYSPLSLVDRDPGCSQHVRGGSGAPPWVPSLEKTVPEFLLLPMLPTRKGLLLSVQNTALRSWFILSHRKGILVAKGRGGIQTLSCGLRGYCVYTRLCGLFSEPLLVRTSLLLPNCLALFGFTVTLGPGRWLHFMKQSDWLTFWNVSSRSWAPGDFCGPHVSALASLLSNGQDISEKGAGSGGPEAQNHPQGLNKSSRHEVRAQESAARR